MAVSVRTSTEMVEAIRNAAALIGAGSRPSKAILLFTMKIAIQGERGAFSHQAALQLVRGADVLACATSVQVFDALDSAPCRRCRHPR